MSYVEADRHCSHKYQGHLVYIFDRETNEFVKGLLNEGTCHVALIGLNDRKSKSDFWWGEKIKIGNFSCWEESRNDDNRKATAVIITKTVWKKYDHEEKACFVCQVLAATSVPEVECSSAAEGSRNISVLCVTKMADTSTFKGSNLSNARHSMHCNRSHCTQPPGVEGRVEINSTHVDTVMLIDVVIRSHGGVNSSETCVQMGFEPHTRCHQLYNTKGLPDSHLRVGYDCQQFKTRGRCFPVLHS
ncbi:uncharacterized protein LOC131936198 [Physella acuta]|uniref:uncharacterized protein LOC131936198 n=1 Tax=Physella acuta TaxID=109671 RepID=UPI0027DCFEB5|nr:uncharacterized protein LOC131936198 [Physella acuta]